MLSFLLCLWLELLFYSANFNIFKKYITYLWNIDSDSDNIPDDSDAEPLKPNNCVWFGASGITRPPGWWIDSPSKPVYDGVGSNKYNYVYDIAGNLKTKTENGTIITRYYYNAQNKLARVDLSDGGYYEFLYDSQNRRIALCHNGTWRKIIHNGNIPIGELDATNGISRWFVRGLGIAEGTGDVIAELRTEDGGQMTAHYYLSNHRGDTLVVLSQSGTVECELQYDAFGLPITEYRLPNTDFSPKFTFSTKEYLSDAELYLYAYRAYDPIAGRWTQRDPIDYQDSVNLYQFCGNNPVNRVDELGLDVNDVEYIEVDAPPIKLEDVPGNDKINKEEWEISTFNEKLATYNTLSEIQRNGGNIQGNISPKGEMVDGVTTPGPLKSSVKDSFLASLMKSVKELGNLKASYHIPGSPSLNYTVYSNGKPSSWDVDLHNPSDSLLSHTCDAIQQIGGYSKSEKVFNELYRQNKINFWFIR